MQNTGYYKSWEIFSIEFGHLKDGNKVGIVN